MAVAGHLTDPAVNVDTMLSRSIAAVLAIVTVLWSSAGLAAAPTPLGPINRAATATAPAVAGPAELRGLDAADNVPKPTPARSGLRVR